MDLPGRVKPSSEFVSGGPYRIMSSYMYVGERTGVVSACQVRGCTQGFGSFKIYGFLCVKEA